MKVMMTVYMRRYARYLRGKTNLGLGLSHVAPYQLQRNRQEQHEITVLAVAFCTTRTEVSVVVAERHFGCDPRLHHVGYYGLSFASIHSFVHSTRSCRTPRIRWTVQ